MKRIVILGAGTAGTIMANRLHAHYTDQFTGHDVRITVVDQDDAHLFQPGLLFVAFGICQPNEIVRPRGAQLSPGVEFLQTGIDRVDAAGNRVVLRDGASLPYDVLIVATGTRVVPEETEGMTGPGWRERVFAFYTLPAATALADALARFDGGHLVVNVVDMPIKCPVAPLEFAFLADWFFTQRGIRDRVRISYVTPLGGAFTTPVAAATLSHLLVDKDIELVTRFRAASVDGLAGRLRSGDERDVSFDLLVTVPLHRGAEFVGRSPGLGDDRDFVLTDPHTLGASVAPNVFAIGDATNTPASKAGSVAHFAADVLLENVARFLDCLTLDPAFDGHSNCFIETGHRKALVLDFNYDVEPLPGNFPFAYGPMRLLRESRINHLAKMAIPWVYWHLLLPGRDIPGIPSRMRITGKLRPLPAAANPPSAPSVAREPANV
jgi:sulfide:quinone oxidoreductase